MAISVLLAVSIPVAKGDALAVAILIFAHALVCGGPRGEAWGLRRFRRRSWTVL